MAYLTKSNSLKIIARIDFKQIGNLEGEVYIKPIYFFSDYEKNNLLGLKELLKDPEKFIKEYYKPVETKDNFKYIFEGGQPAYHFKPDCERLNSNYKNFEIPQEIRDKGKDEVLKFRAWFKENQYLLDKPDVFVARIQMAFGFVMNPKAIDYENSGVEEKENLNLEELEKRINKFIFDAGQYYNNANQEKKEIIRRFQKYTFLAYSLNDIQNNNTRFNDGAIKKFLKHYDVHFKRPIKDLLIEYYRVKHNPELKFEGQLLEQLGFKPCAACHKDIKEIIPQQTTKTNEN
jgi:hypothetical protein